MAAQLYPTHVDAVHAGQHQVQQDQVGAQLAHCGERLGAITDDRGVETFAPQHDGQHLGQRSVVVDHENPLPHDVHGVTRS